VIFHLYHRISAQALEKLAKGLSHKLSSNLGLHEVKNLLCWVPRPRMQAPLLDPESVQLKYKQKHFKETFLKSKLFTHF
jgi:hypothetical protein